MCPSLLWTVVLSTCITTPPGGCTRFTTRALLLFLLLRGCSRFVMLFWYLLLHTAAKHSTQPYQHAALLRSYMLLYRRAGKQLLSTVALIGAVRFRYYAFYFTEQTKDGRRSGRGIVPPPANVVYWIVFVSSPHSTVVGQLLTFYGCNEGQGQGQDGTDKTGETDRTDRNGQWRRDRNRPRLPLFS